MRILDLHIDGFGKLVDFSFRAQPGVNLIYGENEYGKSTLLAFIRAMLYGFGKRSGGRLKDFDRRKYLPWNHSAYGGSMTFLYEGTVYRLERSFAVSRAEDKTVLSVDSTGARIDLAAEEPGSFLFRYDEAAFVNTVYIGQLAAPFSKTGRDPDILSAHLINLSKSGDENVSFDEIDRRLQTEANKIKAARGQGGLLTRLAEELENNRSTAMEAATIREEITSTLAMIREKKQHEQDLLCRQEELLAQLSRLRGRSDQLKEKELEAGLMLRTLEEHKDMCIENMSEQEREKRQFKDRMSGQKLRIRELQELIRVRNEDMATRERELLLVSTEIKRTAKEREELQKLKIRFRDTMLPAGWMMLLPVLATCAGFFLLLYQRIEWLPASLLLALPAVGLLAVNRIQLDRASRHLARLIREQEARILMLQTLREASRGFEESVQIEMMDLESLEHESDSPDNAIEAGVSEVEVMEARIRAGRKHLLDLRELSGQIRQEMAGLLAEEQGISTALTEVRVSVARLETAKDAALLHMPEESRVEEEGELIKEKIERMTKRYEAINAAREALGRAYSDMEHSFVPYVNERTASYLSELTGQTYAALRVDREFSVEILMSGGDMYRSLDYFSGGTVDQLYLSLRLAIGDAIQDSKEHLPLLLDDAFVQYDDKRALSAVKILRRLSEKRQVFLFTCHERMRDMYDETGKNE